MTPQEASTKYHWLKVDESTRTIELFMDHQMLSTLRTCEAKFQLEHLVNLRPHGYKSWNLTYGAFIHKCLEHFYNSMRDDPNGTPLPIQQFLEISKIEWDNYNMQGYQSFEPKFKTLGGLAGALALLAQYHAFYQDLRVRVIDTEVCFGFEREVPIGQFTLCIGDREMFPGPYGMTRFDDRKYTIKCFLTGRMDLIVDNGWKIGAVDHKNHNTFRGDEDQKFNPSDGITGYMLAIRTILQRRFPQYFEKRDCRMGWIYHLSMTTPKNLNRFKASPISKSDSQFEEYKQRNLSTFKRVAEMLFQDSEPQWNTSACPNIYMRNCEYKPLHEIIPEERLNLMQQNYWIAPAWNPAEPDKDQFIKRDKVDEAVVAMAEE